MTSAPLTAHFLSAATNALGALLEPLGYSIASHETGLVEFSKKGITIALQYDDQRSFEIQLCVEFNANDGSSFTLRDIIEAFDEDPRVENLWHQASDAESIDHCVQNISARLSPYLLNLESETACAQLSKVRTARSDRYNVDLKMSTFRAELSESWERQDYRRVIQLCKHAEFELSKSEKLKYVYAQKQMK
jgi:hypothetical protein